MYRRAVAKESMRLGRELLASLGEDQEGGANGGKAKSRQVVLEARAALRRSVRTYPLFRRSYLYLLSTYLDPVSCLASRQCYIPRRARALNQPVAMVDIDAGKLLDISARPTDGHLIDDVGRAQPEVEPLTRLSQKTLTST